MCMVSFVGNEWSRTVPERYPWVPVTEPPRIVVAPPDVTRDELDRLRAEVRELRELLLAAKEFDAATGQPDCEMDEKVALIRRVAEFVGVDVDDVFAPTT